MDLQMPPKVTDRAFDQLKAISEASGTPKPLRVAVEGGCGREPECDVKLRLRNILFDLKTSKSAHLDGKSSGSRRAYP